MFAIAACGGQTTGMGDGSPDSARDVATIDTSPADVLLPIDTVPPDDAPEFIDVTFDASESDSATCGSGRALCNGMCVDVSSDPANCGACGMTCGVGSVCAAGVCATSCGPRVLCNGACVDLTTDPTNCGQCGNLCAGGTVCTAGRCGCLGGAPLCNGVCADTMNDPANCGACGRACAAGQGCNAGVCGIVCGPPRVVCTSGVTQTCADLRTDNGNCGTCGNLCAGGTACTNGACACPAGNGLCNGRCIDLSNDPTNCGTCGNVCAAGVRCTAGACGCNAPFGTCNGRCVDLRNDAANCGTCGNLCTGGTVCNAGSCSCPSGQAFCNGRCVSVQSDIANCGACGRACASGQLCTAGVCGCVATCNGACTDTRTDANNCGACGNVCPAGASCGAGSCSRLVAGLGGPAGYGTPRLALSDDGSECTNGMGAVDLTVVAPGGLNYYGVTYRQLCVNNNGNLNFTNSAMGNNDFTPAAFPQASGTAIIAPWFADVDTRSGNVSIPGDDAIYYDLRSGQFVATWLDVGYYSMHTDHRDSFQVVIRARSDVSPGDFDVELRYARCEWTTGDASGGTGGLGGTPAQAGFNAGDGARSLSLPGSGTAAILSLCSTSNVSIPGVWQYRVRGGVVMP